jgi:hypothetical protein
MPTETAKHLTPDIIVEAYRKYKLGQKSGNSMATSNWPTALAHECRAYAVFNRTVPPENRRKIDERLAMIFSEGTDQERMVARDLAEAGFEVTGQQGQIVWKEFQISGRRDLILYKPGYAEKVRVEIKSSSPYTYEALNKAEDLLDSEKSWFKRWGKQIALYIWLEGIEQYLLLLKNKVTGDIKIIPFTMNERVTELADEMLQKAKWVNRLVQLGEMPKQEDRIADSDFCSECVFFDACLPDLTFGPGAVILTDESVAELTAQLERREELQPLKKEFEKLDEELKSIIKSMASEGQTKIVIGDWVADLKDRNRAAYSVKATSFREVKFMKVNP